MTELIAPNTGVYEFGEFRLIPAERVLLRKDELVSLSPKLFDVLVILVENHGHLVEKDELLDRVWADAFVEEATLARTVSRLRKILRADVENSYIETVAGSGYRFSTSVEYVEEEIKLTNSNSPDSDTSIKDAELSEENLINENDQLPEIEKWSWRVNPRLVLTVGLLILLITVWAFIWNPTPQMIPNAASIESMAVLPFNVLGEKDDGALGAGMAETLTIKLNGVNEIIIRPSSAVSKYAGQETIDSAAIGRELKVDAVLNGNIQRDGDRLRVTVLLISSLDGTSLWAGKFDTSSKDIFLLQDDISAQVSKALELKLSGKEQKQLTKRYTENTDAYQAYITGRYLWSKRDPVSLQKSLEYFEKAIEIDNQYALAYTGVADCYEVFVYYRIMPANEGYAKARSAARKALEIDDTLAEAHTTLGYILAFYDWNWEAAEKEFKRAIELDPNYAVARHHYAEYLNAIGRSEEALEELNKALALDPLSLAINAELAGYYYQTRQFDKGLEQANKLIELEPEFPLGYAFRFFIFQVKGMEREAIDEYLKVAKNYFRNSEAEIEELRNAYEKGGKRAFWLKRIEQMERSPDHEIYAAWDYMGCYFYLGDKDRTFEWLEKSYKNRDRWIANLKYNPAFDSIREDPRFRDIIRRTGLE